MRNFWLLLVLSCISTEAMAWSKHFLITRAALREISDLHSPSKKIKPTPFEPMIRALGFESSMDFKIKSKIKKSYAFKIEDDSPRTPAEILSAFSDEPDWGMDREVFDDYPSEWRPEYAEMGGRKNVESQAFRHMYWGPLSWNEPLVTFKIPLTLKSMGKAPERAEFFIELARKAKAKGYSYWSLRFLANALHYLEDVSQPFHACQVQTKKFMLFPFLNRYGSGPIRYVKQVTNVISYYHQAFEYYIGYIMDAEPNSSEGQKFENALAGTAETHDELGADTVGNLVRSISIFSSKRAPEAARTSVSFFPSTDEYFQKPEIIKRGELRGKPYKLADLFVTEYLSMDNDQWLKEALAHGRDKSSEKDSYFALVASIFQQLGVTIRRVVQSEMSSQPVPLLSQK